MATNRYFIVGVTAAAALLLYIDRVCISILADPIQLDLELAPREKELALSAFFFTYALFQIPIGSLADRYGPRAVLTASIVAWSAVTAMTGLAWSFASLLTFRLLLGLCESGAYPAGAALVKRWAKPEERGRLNAIVLFGGRIGGAFAPALTTTVGKSLVAVGIAGTAIGDSTANWRDVFLLYGACGLAVAALFWLFVRDRPQREANGTQNAGAPPSFSQALKLIGRNRTTWCFGALQVCLTLPWAFLVTLLPTYLKDANVEIDLRSTIQTGILLAGCAGMILGGLLTDAVNKRLGPRWGRSLPPAILMLLCGSQSLLLSLSPALWVAVAALAITSLCLDLSLPSLWSYAQDVAGKNAGAVFGFGNMCGNLGASLSPLLLGAVSRAAGWEGAFAVCASCYFVAAIFGLLLDASKPLDPCISPRM